MFTNNIKTYIRNKLYLLGYNSNLQNGFVSEWPMVQPWKGCVGYPTESSNLSETTIQSNKTYKKIKCFES